MIEPENVTRWHRELRAMLRKAADDPEALAQVTRLLTAAQESLITPVNRLRGTGYSDSDIGRALGVTRQAVRQRWPHRQP